MTIAPDMPPGDDDRHIAKVPLPFQPSSDADSEALQAIIEANWQQEPTSRDMIDPGVKIFLQETASRT